MHPADDIFNLDENLFIQKQPKKKKSSRKVRSYMITFRTEPDR
jgi:hypothetical protein